MKKKTLIIYDDDPDILEICKIILSPRLENVITRNNCENWQEDLEEIRPSVIIMDNRIMPFGGYNAIKEIKLSAFSNIPVIFFSAHEQLEKLAKEAQADYFLKKPFELTDLESIVEKALGQTS